MLLSSCACENMMVDTTLEEAPPFLMLVLNRDGERQRELSGNKAVASRAVKINKEVELTSFAEGKVSRRLPFISASVSN